MNNGNGKSDLPLMADWEMCMCTSTLVGTWSGMNAYPGTILFYHQKRGAL